MDIKINEFESLYYLKECVCEKNLIVCGDMQSHFFAIYLDGKIMLGIAYYHYGIDPQLLYSKDDGFLYLGFGMNFLGIDLYKERVVINKKLQSVFYEIVHDSTRKYICIVCELDLYCYFLGKIKWSMGFRDIVTKYWLVNDKSICVLCDDGLDYAFSLESGKLVEVNE